MRGEALLLFLPEPEPLAYEGVGYTLLCSRDQGNVHLLKGFLFDSLFGFISQVYIPRHEPLVLPTF